MHFYLFVNYYHNIFDILLYLTKKIVNCMNELIYLKIVTNHY